MNVVFTNNFELCVKYHCVQIDSRKLLSTMLRPLRAPLVARESLPEDRPSSTRPEWWHKLGFPRNGVQPGTIPLCPKMFFHDLSFRASKISFLPVPTGRLLPYLRLRRVARFELHLHFSRVFFEFSGILL